MQLKAKRQTKKHMKQKTKVNKKNIRSKNTQRRFRNKRRTKKKRLHKGGTYYSDCKAKLKDIFLELEGENDTKSKPNNKLIYRKITNEEPLSEDEKNKIEKYMYYTNIPSEEQQETIDKLIPVVKNKKNSDYVNSKNVIKGLDMNQIPEMLEHFKIFGFLNKNKLSEGWKDLKKCKYYKKFELAKYARSGSRSYKNVHILEPDPKKPRELRFYKNVDIGYLINEEMPISAFLSRINHIYEIQMTGIEQLKYLIEKYNPDSDNNKITRLTKNITRLTEYIEQSNPNNNILSKNTEEWMELFNNCLKVLNGKTQEITNDGYDSDKTDKTDETEPFTDEETE